MIKILSFILLAVLVLPSQAYYDPYENIRLYEMDTMGQLDYSGYQMDINDTSYMYLPPDYTSNPSGGLMEVRIQQMNSLDNFNSPYWSF